MNQDDVEVQATLQRIGVPTAQRHAFLCTGPECCTTAEGESTWNALKAQLKAAGVPVLRSKAACLRVCSRGPWLLVYPEGTWYPEVTPERCARIVAEHLVGGRPVEEWAVARHALGAAAQPHGE
jgi:(2Fe-2S) ferredoxin